MGAQILVLPSPLLGPAAYTAFVDALVRAGHDAYLASGAVAAAQDRSDIDAADPDGSDPSRNDPAGSDRAGRDPAASRSAADRLVARWTDHAVRLDATALLAHSNAGFLAPIVRARVGRDLPVIFMDAALPPVSEPTTLAPEGFRAFLATL